MGFFPALRDMFRQLIRVNGVGPKMGLAILSGLNVNEFILCVTQHDVARLIKVPGVGKRPERLIVEMQDRLPVLESGQHQRMSPSVSSGKDRLGDGSKRKKRWSRWVIKAQDASRVVKSVMKPDDCLEDVIRNALKGMVKLSDVVMMSAISDIHHKNLSFILTLASPCP